MMQGFQKVALRSTKAAIKRAAPVSQHRLFMSASKVQQSQLVMAQVAARKFSDAAVVSQQDQESEVDTRDENARLGIDTEFSQQKHAYVLTFPWNFDEIIDEFQARYRPQSSGFWPTFVKNSGAMGQFHELFREFHQMCALHDAKGINKLCEGNLATAVNESLDRIHFHGLDVEMANLTVEQPNIQVLKVEISHGLSLERTANGTQSDWVESKSSILGAPCTYYTPTDDQRDLFDGLDADHKPYCVSVTALIESPMKLFVQNQNYSKILLGNDNQEMAKNVVRFECNMRWSELFDILPPAFNKTPRGWKITDYNNLMNENPQF